MQKFKGYVHALRGLFPDIKFDASIIRNGMYIFDFFHFILFILFFSFLVQRGTTRETEGSSSKTTLKKMDLTHLSQKTGILESSHLSRYFLEPLTSFNIYFYRIGTDIYL